MFITYLAVISASAQNSFDSFACANILRTHSMMVRFILSTNPFNSGVFGTVYLSRILFDRQYSSNCPRYSPSLSARTAFSFRPVSLSTLLVFSVVFSGETHSFRMWSSMNVTKYYHPTCDFVSTWHTSVCTSSNNAFHLIGGLTRKEVRFCFPSMQSVHFSSCTLS